MNSDPDSFNLLSSSILRKVFGYSSFKNAQQDIVLHVLDGNDAFVLMPTGGGKSLCYQIPAIARHQQGLGIAIVISPLIALMQDQVGALHEAGVEAAFLNSTLTTDESAAVEKRLLQDELTLLYAAPERITTPRFLALLDHLHEKGKLSLFAIDEAHCVSQWGHDFRPEYRALTVLHERYASVPRIALTATADQLTREDIAGRLQLQNARVFINSFDRPNIRYSVVEKRDPAKQLLQFIEREHLGDAGIVYCQTRKKVEAMAQMLGDAGILALPYHAGLDSAIRSSNMRRFLREDGMVMVATIAFGMGIDKPDVRFVAHLDLPKNMESYYQETGRAGRDGLPANAWMCYGLQDVVNQRRMIDESSAPDEIRQLMRSKLDALLTYAESASCRRITLLGYFGETSVACMNCDNCLHPPELWDASDAARKLLSTIYRIQQADGKQFGGGHLLDIVRGKQTEKVDQYQHQLLSTFGVGKEYSEQQLRAVLRQLIAMDALEIEAGEFNTLRLCEGSRAVLKGERQVLIRQAVAAKTDSRHRRNNRLGAITKAPIQLDSEALLRYAALKAWRSEVAREHNLPAYVIFHDATLAGIAQSRPQSLDELATISGIGARKLEAYGEQVLKVTRD